MPRVKVHLASDVREATAGSAFGDLAEVTEAIRNRAFQIFQERGGQPGGELDDWLQAEQDLFFVPEAEVSESSREFRMSISAAGFCAADIEVVAMPRELLVEAKAERRLEPIRDNMRAGSLERRTLYRRFGLTSTIETEKVTARIDEGRLTIEAPKKLTGRTSVRAAAA